MQDLDVGLDERKQRVLRIVVEDYVATATPVGSRTIARKYKLGVSPATIRNEMADLEEMGFLRQPHTSAGRVPSDKGYRFYVDRLMTVGRLSSDDLRRIESVFATKAKQLSWLIQETVKVISHTTQYMALVVGPCIAGNRLARLNIVRLSPTSATMVLVTDTGFVASRILEVPEGMSDKELNAVADILNSRLKDLSLSELAGAAFRELYAEVRRYRFVVEQILDVVYELFKSQEEEEVWVGGRTKIFEHPEFRDVTKAMALLDLVESPDFLHLILSQGLPGCSEDLTITIGEEIPVEGLKDCSIVSVGFTLGNRRLGRIGVIGPKRMNYARTVAVVELVGKAFSEALARAVGA